MKDIFILGISVIIVTLFTSCNSKEIEMPIGFTSSATIVDNSPEGYYCYFKNSESYLISQDGSLKGIERGCFGFTFDKDEWNKYASVDWTKLNPRINSREIYPIIKPISEKEIIESDILEIGDLSIPKHMSISPDGFGYLDISGNFNIFNNMDAQVSPCKLYIVYNPNLQSSDSLQLQFYCIPDIPNEWHNTSFISSRVACDISSLSHLQEWNDSVTIALNVTEEITLYSKIAKSGFSKPTKR